MKRYTDIEVLGAAEMLETRCIFYVYRTGCLKQQFQNRVEKVVIRDGRMAMSCAPNELVSIAVGAGLFNGLYICDWSRASSGRKPGMAELASSLEGEGDGKFLIFVRSGDASFNVFESECCVLVEEELVREESVETTVRFLCQASELRGARDLWLTDGFCDYFRFWISEEGAKDLFSFQKEFEKAVILYADVHAGAFDFSTAVQERDGRSHLLRAVLTVLEDRDEAAISRAFTSLSKIRARAAADVEVIDHLNRVFTVLADRFLEPGKAYLDRRLLAILLAAYVCQAGRLYCAASSLSSSESCGDLVPTLCDQVLRQFVMLSDFDELSDHLAKSEIARRPDSDRLPIEIFGEVLAATKDLAWRLFAEAPSPWAAMLARYCAELVDSDHNGDSRWAVSDSTLRRYEFPLVSIGSIPHQDVIVRSIQSRFRLDDHSVPILLCGTSHFAKDQIAMSYAAGLLCEKPPAPGENCGSCSECRAVHTRNSHGLIEANVNPGNVADVKTKLADLAYQPLTPQRVIIIDGLDRSIEVEEACLEALEGGRSRTVFILLAERLERLRAATVSRCFLYRVMPPPASN
ncbi:MAG: hypothetical protein J0G33_12640 [Afipia felis]|nr:hypothetical protein [Afipia felis]